MLFRSCTQFSLKPLKNPEEFWARVQLLIEDACARKADLILFPEYFSLSLIFSLSTGTFRERLLSAAKIEEDFVRRLQDLCDENDIAIVAGTFPHSEGDRILNRSWILLPGEPPIFQEKFHMTRLESETWNISSGKPELRLFRHAGALCAVAICYDVEFPNYCAAAAQSKVDILDRKSTRLNSSHT